MKIIINAANSHYLLQTISNTPEIRYEAKLKLNWDLFKIGPEARSVSTDTIEKLDLYGLLLSFKNEKKRLKFNFLKINYAGT